MKASDLVTAPVYAGAALRHRRFFHPAGVLANGTLERTAPPGDGLPVESGQIVGRISKGLGTPGGLPDFAGLAWRMPPAVFASTPWDVLLVSAGFGLAGPVPNRVLLRPVASWSDAAYSSLMPLRHREDLWWVRARLTTPLASTGLSLDAVRDGINRSGIRFEVEQACGTGSFTPLATLAFNEVVSGPQERDQNIAFDPVLHTTREVSVWPGWLAHLRELAYRSSREGRRGG